MWNQGKEFEVGHYTHIIIEKLHHELSQNQGDKAMVKPEEVIGK